MHGLKTMKEQNARKNIPTSDSWARCSYGSCRFSKTGSRGYRGPTTAEKMLKEKLEEVRAENNRLKSENDRLKTNIRILKED